MVSLLKGILSHTKDSGNMRRFLMDNLDIVRLEYAVDGLRHNLKSVKKNVNELINREEESKMREQKRDPILWSLAIIGEHLFYIRSLFKRCDAPLLKSGRKSLWSLIKSSSGCLRTVASLIDLSLCLFRRNIHIKEV